MERERPHLSKCMHWVRGFLVATEELWRAREARFSLEQKALLATRKGVQCQS